jgi:PAS domain-containing protein
MSARKPHVPSMVIRHDSDSEMPEWKRNLLRSLHRERNGSLPSLPVVGHDYMTVVDLDRRYVQVSDDFCKLVGYEREAHPTRSIDPSSRASHKILKPRFLEQTVPLGAKIDLEKTIDRWLR